MNGKRLICMVALTAIVMTLPSANAGIFGDGLGGAFQGAMLGSLIDGRDGAAAGAVIGGLIGAGESASRNKSRKQDAESRQAEWAASQQAEQQRLRQQQAAAAPVQSADQTLVIESQKSLIRLGFEPGDLGQTGPALTEAVIGYQRGQGLLETGQLSQALLTHMLRDGG